MKFSIYHALPDYPESEDLFKQRVHVIDVEAAGVNEARALTQDWLNPEYSLHELRNTRVGDIIVDEDNNTYLINRDGYELVPSSILSYIDWGKNLPRLAQTKLITYQ